MKQVFLLTLSCFALSGVFAQTFSHGVGITVFSTQAQGSSGQVSGAITYSPRINFVESDSYALSVGIPLSLGASGSVSSQSGGNNSNSLSFLVNLPLVLNFNMGAGSTKDNEDKFGFFAGAGFGYHYGSFNETETDGYGDDYSDETTVSSYGPVADGGVRIALGGSGHNLEIRAMYMKGIDASKADIVGIGALFNF